MAKELETLSTLWKVENKLVSINRIKAYAYNGTTPNDCYIGRINSFLNRITKCKTEKELYDCWDNINSITKNNITFVKCLYITRTNLKYAIQTQETYCIMPDRKTLEGFQYLIDYNILDYFDNYAEEGQLQESITCTIRDILNLTYDYAKMLDNLEQYFEEERLNLLKKAREELKEQSTKGGQTN